MTDSMYRQCKLKRASNANELVEYVAWIPAKYATQGKKIIVNDVEWDVVYASAVEMPGDAIHDTHRLDKILPSLQKKKNKRRSV